MKSITLNDVLEKIEELEKQKSVLIETAKLMFSHDVEIETKTYAGSKEEIIKTLSTHQEWMNKVELFKVLKINGYLGSILSVECEISRLKSTGIIEKKDKGEDASFRLKRKVRNVQRAT